MKKRMVLGRVVGVVWFALLVLGLCCAALADDSGSCGNSLTWELSGGTLTISGQGAMAEYTINAMPPWLGHKDNIRTVVMSDDVTTVSDYAFNGCSNLTAVSLPKKLKTIGINAFGGCYALTQIDFPDGLTEISGMAFDGCGLTNIVLPDSVTTLGDQCFNSTNATSLTLSKGLTRLPYYSFTNGMLTTLTIPENLEVIGAYSFQNQGNLKEIRFPAGLKEVNYNAFTGCINLTDVYYDGTVEQSAGIQIGTGNEKLAGAMWHCADGVTQGIGLTGGVGADGLAWEIVNNTLRISGNGPMSEYDIDRTPPWQNKKSQITAVVIEPGVTSVGAYAFDSCAGLASVDLPRGIGSIGVRAFSGCNALRKIDFPEGLTEIGSLAFDPSGLQEVVLPDSVTTLGDQCFYGSNISSLTLSKGLTSLPYYCFSNGMLTTLTIPEGLEVIGPYSFQNQWNLKEIHLPVALKEVNYSAFANCANLTDVYYAGTIAQSEQIVIGSDNGNLANVTWHCSDGTTRGTGPTSGIGEDGLAWKIANGVLTISGKGAMTEYDINRTPPWENKKAQITSVVVEPGVTSIGGYSFRQYTNLASVTLPIGIRSIGTDAFGGCTQLTQIDFPEGLIKIGTMAFDGSGLRNVVLPDTVEVLEDQCFYSTALTSLTLSKGLARLPYFCFTNGSMTSLTIPDGLAIIGPYSFQNQSGMREVHFPSSLTNIQYSAFGWCTGLTDVYYDGTIAQASGIALGVDNGPINNATWHCSDGTVRGITFGTENCGSDVTWELIGSVLTIRGNGAMADYSIRQPASWNVYRDQIRVVKIENGVTSVGAYAFKDLSRLRIIAIPQSLNSVKSCAFDGCSNLGFICSDAYTYVETGDGNNPFKQATRTYSREDLLSKLPGKATLPSNLNAIRDEAFSGTNIRTIIVPSSVSTIGNKAFANSQALQYVSLPETVSLAADIFENTPDVILICQAGGAVESWALSHRVSAIGL